MAGSSGVIPKALIVTVAALACAVGAVNLMFGGPEPTSPSNPAPAVTDQAPQENTPAGPGTPPEGGPSPSPKAPKGNGQKNRDNIGTNRGATVSENQ